jgi:carbonic anhydrase
MNLSKRVTALSVGFAKTPVKIAGEEIAAFGKIYPMNARPTQPVNGRAIRATN